MLRVNVAARELLDEIYSVDFMGRRLKRSFGTALKLFDKRAIFALFIGCLVSNIFGGLGMYDIIFGSVFTLIAAFLTYKMKSIYMAGMPPVIINAFGVGLYLSLLFKLPYWTTVIYIGLGELISVYGIGLPLFLYLSRRKILQRSEVV
ncbi:MAG TPA: QueT transporter family protein [Candidatus Atribacteria bacterium]|nr:QueT transporter family protein [Candidatus Atribacteria bacterium]